VGAALADAFSASDLPWKVDLVDWVRASESFRRIIEHPQGGAAPASSEQTAGLP
jgi:type I restriction enzyme S subunit